MIGRLAGTLLLKKPPALLLDVNGVGYELEAPMSTFYSLPEVGGKVVLLVHTHVREDALQLYGFAHESERRLFRSLIKVSGIGAKLALTILSGIEVDAFVRCVQAEDSSALTRLPGVGKKTAERLVIEMRDKIESSGRESMPAGMITAHNVTVSPVEEAVSALVALGYKAQEASRMVRGVEKADAIENAEEVIRLALKAAVK